MNIGVLALQGNFEEHIEAFERIGIKAFAVRKSKDLQNIHGLVIPGGESTSISKLIYEMSLDEGINGLKDENFPIFGTCAGLIVMSSEIEDDNLVKPLHILPVKVKRNAYGRQRESFITPVKVKIDNKSMEIEGVFIRAPKITWVSPEVEILGEFKDEIVLVKYKNFLGATFHPELTYYNIIHSYFVSLVERRLREK